MKVTSATFNAVKNERMPSMLGLASIVMDGALVIKDIKVITGKYGPFLGFPSRRNEDKTYYDVVFPLSKELRTEMTEAVLKEMNKVTPKPEESFIPAAEPTTSEDEELPF